MKQAKQHKVLRLGVLLFLVAGVSWAAWSLTAGETPLKQVARDYLAFERVRRHADVLAQASEESGVDAYLLAAIMVAESSGRVNAKSSKGAMGLFQVSRTTATWRAEKLGLEAPTEEELLSDPLLNARLGADNMAWLLDSYDGNVDRALVAYNAGMGKLSSLEREAGGWHAWRAEREAAGDSQLLGYVNKVNRYRDMFREDRLFDID